MDEGLAKDSVSSEDGPQSPDSQPSVLSSQTSLPSGVKAQGTGGTFQGRLRECCEETTGTGESRVGDLQGTVWHLGWQPWKVSLSGLKGSLARAEVLKVLWSSVKAAVPSWGSMLHPLQVSLCQRRAGWDADLGQMGAGAGLVDDDHVRCGWGRIRISPGCHTSQAWFGGCSS